MQEMFKMQIKDQPSYEMLLTSLIRDKHLKLEFDDLKVTCPQCKEDMKDITYIQLDEKDIELLNKTELKDVWITIEACPGRYNHLITYELKCQGFYFCYILHCEYRQDVDATGPPAGQ